MNFGEILCLSLIGLLLVYAGCLIFQRKQFTVLQKYHYRNIKEEDKENYASVMGIGNCITGAGVCAAPYLNLLTGTSLGWYVCAAGIILGLGLMIFSQFKFNGGLF